MKITSITYSRLVSTERFGNVKVEATASIDPTDDRDEAFKELRQWVDLEVLTKKHQIEGKIATDPDDEIPYAQQMKPQPQPQRAPMNGASIGAQQISKGTIIEINASGQMTTSDRPQMIRSMDGSAIPAPDDIAAWYDEHRRTGNAWERADRARAGLPPHQPWLQPHHSTDPHIGDRLEFHDFAQPRADRAFPAGYLLDAIDRGLLIPNRNAPGLIFGPGGETNFLAAAPSFYDEGDEEEDCPACNGQGHNKHTFEDCALCEGDGTVNAERAAEWRMAQ